jgi:hypothetical protein
MNSSTLHCGRFLWKLLDNETFFYNHTLEYIQYRKAIFQMKPSPKKIIYYQSQIDFKALYQIRYFIYLSILFFLLLFIYLFIYLFLALWLVVNLLGIN